MSTFSFVLRVRRRELSLTQTKLGRLARICPKQLSAYERGERHPTKEHFDRLQLQLGRLPCPPPVFEVPAHNCEWRERFRDQSDWAPHEDRPFAVRLNAARLAYPEKIASLQPIVHRRQAWLDRARHGSGVELVSSLSMFDSPLACELAVRLVAWGFRQLPIVDPVTREVHSDYMFPGIGLPIEDGHIVMVRQVPLRSEGFSFVVDGLAGISVGKRTLWVAHEIHGPGHCSRADALRAAHIQVVSSTEAEVLSPTYVADLKIRLRQLLD